MTAERRPQTAPPHVSVVMATRNGARHLAEQLESIAAQTHRNWSLFVSDDGSTDGTVAILQDFARRFPVQIVQGPILGAAANFLSALCHPLLPPGIVALADQDDVWLTGKLSRALRRMEPALGKGPVLYAAESVLTDAALQPLRASSAGRAGPGFGPSLCQNLFGGHTMVLDEQAHRLIRAAGVPDGIAFHDWWVYQLVSGAGGQLILDPAPVARYRQHDTNVLGGAGGALPALRRTGLALRGTWGKQMQAQAQALQSRSHLLNPDAQKTLQDFLSAPKAGPGRIAAFRRLGLRRSSAKGNALMLTAALLGLL